MHCILTSESCFSLRAPSSSSELVTCSHPPITFFHLFGCCSFRYRRLEVIEMRSPTSRCANIKKPPSGPAIGSLGESSGHSSTRVPCTIPSGVVPPAWPEPPPPDDRGPDLFFWAPYRRRYVRFGATPTYRSSSALQDPNLVVLNGQQTRKRRPSQTEYELRRDGCFPPSAQRTTRVRFCDSDDVIPHNLMVCALISPSRRRPVASAEIPC